MAQSDDLAPGSERTESKGISYAISGILGWIVSMPVVRLLALVLIDILLSIGSMSMAFLARLEEIPINRMGPFLVFTVMVRVTVLIVSGSYSVSLRFTSLGDMLRILGLVSVSSLIGAAAVAWGRKMDWAVGSAPYGVVAIDWAFACVAISASRLGRRSVEMVLRQRKAGKRALVIGAGAAGEQIIRSMLSTKGNEYSPVAFLDDDASKQNLTIHGVKVVGRTDAISAVSSKYHITTIIVAIPSAPSSVVRKWFNDSKQAGVTEVLILPTISEIFADRVSIRDIRRLSLEDLLGRDVVRVDPDALRHLISGKKVLVTGSGGSIGSEICRQVGRLDPSMLIMIDQDETGLFRIEQELRTEFPSLALTCLVTDVADATRTTALFQTHHPYVVFHAAAYKHVPMMEVNPEEAVRNNVIGTAIVAQAASNAQVDRFVFISTDKAVEPASIMGKTKRLGELIISEMSRTSPTRFMNVRFGNVMGSRGSVIETFQKQIEQGGPVTVTHPEMTRFFMLTSEAVLLVLQAAAFGVGGETFILDMGHPIRIMDLAEEMIRLAGLDPGKDIPIEIVGTRPGERMHEKLHYDDEVLTPTDHPKVLLARTSRGALPVLGAIERYASGKASIGSREFLDSLLVEAKQSVKA